MIGALALVPLSEFLHAKLGNIVPSIQSVVYGVSIIAVTLLAPEGVFWKVKDMLLRRRVAPVDTPPISPIADVAVAPRQSQQAQNAVLQVRNVSKSFGGLMAVKDVNLQVIRGEILGIIGPNGAGKTTFFNLLNGFTT